MHQIARLILQEWGDQDGDPLCAYREIKQAQHGLPKILYIEQAQQVIAMASLLAEDIDLFPSYTPWLANVYVKPDYR